MTNSIPWPTQRAVRESMPCSAIVDINGIQNPKTGGFHVVQDALDAGHRSVFVRDGNYPRWETTAAYQTIIGESWNVVVFGETDHAIELLHDACAVKNLQAYTTAGGGNNYDVINIGTGGTRQWVDHCYISQSDRIGIVSSLQHLYVTNCYVSTCDTNGIQASNLYSRIYNSTVVSCGADGIAWDTGVADGSIATGNYCASNTGYGLNVDANSNNCIAVGNKFTANAAGNENDASGTSVMNNETT